MAELARRADIIPLWRVRARRGLDHRLVARLDRGRDLPFGRGLMTFYALVDTMQPEYRAYMGLIDRYYLLLCLLHRIDLLKHHEKGNKWLFERCREVEAAPDDHLDLWGRDHYKMLSVKEPIPTPSGWRCHGDLRPGHWVFGPDGKPCRVIARTRVFTDGAAYEIEFDDGVKIRTGADHRWSVERRTKKRIPMAYNRPGPKRRYRETAVLSTREIAAHDHRPDNRLAIRVSAPLDLPATDLPLDPYALGVWLGDGSASGSRVTVGLAEADEMERLLNDTGIAVERLSHSNAVTLRVGSGRRGNRMSSNFTNALRALGVYRNKHIPALYLRASKAQRLALLQGLMDTDGHCDTRGKATFVNTNEALTDGVSELAQTLGLKPSKRPYSMLVNGRAYLYWQVCFQAYRALSPFRIERKLARCKEGARPNPRRYIVACQPIPPEPMSCIQVDRPDGLYLTGRAMVTTHNSTIITFGGSVQELLRDPELTIGIFSHSAKIARSFLWQIMREFETNDELKVTYPTILWWDPKREAPRWSLNEGIVVKRRSNPREASVEAWGVVDGQPTALDCDTPVLTTTGWKRHGDLAFGDFVFDDAGEPVMVVHNTGAMLDKPCSEVVFSDTDIVAANDHLWPVQRVFSPRDPETGKQDSGWSKFAIEIVKTTGLPLGSGPERDKRRRLLRTPTLKMPSRVEFPIPPYVLGLWLGDGSSDSGIITTGDDEIVELLAANGYGVSVAQDRGNYRMYRVAGLREQLKAVSLLWNKHIPKEYLLASEDDRRALLQGLMDSDGSCHSNGWGTCVFTNTNRGLIEGVHYLAASLGMKPSRVSDPRHDGHPNHAARYTVSFLGLKPERPFQLSRKLTRCRDFRRNGGRYVREIRPVETRPVNCIQVASESGLYLAGLALVPTHNSKHFGLLEYDDVWTRENVNTAEQIKKTVEARELSENLGKRGGRQWNIGTRYCTIGTMRVLMADWSHKPIEDVRIGDEIVGWESRDNCNSRRFLRPAKVINRGMHPMQPVNRYVLTNGRSVTCTSDHNWWRGPHGGGPEYAPLGQPRPDRPSRPAKTKKAHGKLSALRELLVPSEIDQGRDAGWLAGFFALTTERIELESIEDAGTQDVHWLETETGNYVIEGFCSSNSYADGYGTMLDRGVLKARIYPATSNGLLSGVPVFLTQEEWDQKKKRQPSQVPAQFLQNPLAGQDRMFKAKDFKGYMARPRTLNVYIMGDPSKGKPNRRSDRTAIAVIGIDAANNKYLLDGYRHRMFLPARWVAIKTLHKKWSNIAGVMTVTVGYEQYGMQTDIEYFEERQLIEKYTFPIEELGWTNDHTRSKEDRVERLVPDITSSGFFMPSVVWNDGELCEWVYDKVEKRIIYRPLEGDPVVWGHMTSIGQAYRNAKPIKRVDEEGRVYDLTAALIEELCSFPFGSHDDLCDATSRIYDLEPAPPVVVSAADLEPTVYCDT
jgi:intein/homing endonuclease